MGPILKIPTILAISALAMLGGCDPEGGQDDAGDGGSLEGGSAGADCTHPLTGQPDTLVECLTDPCSVTSCDADPSATCQADYCGGCHAIFTAADGTLAECDLVTCPADAMLCPDGSYVGRDPASDCAFRPCPDAVACTEDARVCPDGTTLSRDPANDCQFPACPDDTGVVCPTDVKECPDGSYVSRDASNDCAFELCEGECLNPMTGEPDTEVNCLVDPCSVNSCEANPDADCTANYCGGCHAIFTNAAGDTVSCELVACTTDAKQCPDGSYVGRDGSNNCEWQPCP